MGDKRGRLEMWDAPLKNGNPPNGGRVVTIIILHITSTNHYNVEVLNPSV